MRTTILILLWAFIDSFSGFANSYYDEDENKTDIIIEKGEGDDTNKHARIPIYDPITCYYMKGNIYVTTLTDLGEIQISITCLETGSFWKSVNDSNSGTICVPTSSANGNYMVRIVTANGDVYYGYYNL
ncbi:MAG: DUF3244 domain-containing protein [Bacteroidaceae bacterium]|nr:DUF3244 domain-containing protein [Bacteroidaceae bacterium]